MLKVWRKCGADTQQLVLPVWMRSQRDYIVKVMDYENFLAALLEGEDAHPDVWACLRMADMVIGGADFTGDYR